MAAGWLTALKMIPWDDVVANAPAVLRGAKKLWGKAGRSEPTPDRVGALEQEVAQLREQADTAAGVISSLAEQNARLVEAVDLLRVRTRILMAACGVLAVALVAVFLIR
ncbi:MAG TPA: hypothetical protein VJQ58_06515 [Burkholderiales bacterium]|nr:hypothetical protein [Burkholderiales bacterium]